MLIYNQLGAAMTSVSRIEDEPLFNFETQCLTWKSPRSSQVSAWHGHVAFAHWIVYALRPKVIVELGTHNGVSYSAFCNSVKKIGLDTKCFAIDTWDGDFQAGYYSSAVYDNILAFNKKNYSHFSRLLRMMFDEALQHFDDGSIDLLHIDGLHTYEAVKHDFETWLPKLSDGGIVLFHDIDVYQPGFGVHILWKELRKRYKTFSFYHSHGLGVLSIGGHQSPKIDSLLRSDNNDNGDNIRYDFEALSNLAKTRKIEIFKTDHLGTNVALNKITRQSSVLEESKVEIGSAVNGVKDGGYGFHTCYESSPWWEVDLGQIYNIKNIVVFNRVDPLCKTRSASLSVKVSNDGDNWNTIHNCNGQEFGGVDEDGPLLIKCFEEARFVRLQLECPNYLHLDEVEVFTS